MLIDDSYASGLWSIFSESLTSFGSSATFSDLARQNIIQMKAIQQASNTTPPMEAPMIIVSDEELDAAAVAWKQKLKN